jgi:hypothetical protein
MMDYPLLVFAVSLVTLWLSGRVGASMRSRHPEMEESQRQDLSVIVNAALTLLALITGFSFSMAIARYDLRKSDEATEANAIGTDYVRADFLSAADAARLHGLLRNYADQRILFYTTRNERQLEQTSALTAQLQRDMWSLVRETAPAQPGLLSGLSVSGMNDVLNSQAYAQAAWWNRIPTAAWTLMAAIAISCNALFVYSAHTTRVQFFLLPLILSIAFFLIADIDSPRRGLIRVRPQNIEALSQSLHALDHSGLPQSTR